MLGALLVTEQPEMPAVKEEPREEEEPTKPMKLEALHSCQTCGKTFSNDSDFAKHIRSHIIPERSLRGPYKCKKCPNRYKKLAKLREHVNIHNKKHICSICKNGFTSAQILKQHFIQKHTNDVSQEPAPDSMEVSSPARWKFAPTIQDVLALEEKSNSTPDSDVQEAAESIMSLRNAAEAAKSESTTAKDTMAENRGAAPSKESDVELEEFIPRLPKETASALSASTVMTLNDSNAAIEDSSGIQCLLGSEQSIKAGNEKVSTTAETNVVSETVTEDRATVEVSTEAAAAPRTVSRVLEMASADPETAPTSLEKAPTPEITPEGAPTMSEIASTQETTPALGIVPSPEVASTTPEMAPTPETTLAPEAVPTAVIKRGRGRPRKSMMKIEVDESVVMKQETVVKTEKSQLQVTSPHIIKTPTSAPLRVLPRRANRGMRTTGKFADKVMEYSPKKKNPGVERRGRPRLIKTDDGAAGYGEGKGEENKDEHDVDADDDGEDDLEYVDDDEDTDFRPPRNGDLSDDDFVSDDHPRLKKRRKSNFSESRKPRKKRVDKDEELASLVAQTVVITGENGDTLYKCGPCGKKFTHMNYLKLHLPAHTDRYKCNDCGKRFTRNESYQKHQCLKTEHTYYIKKKVSEEEPDIYCCRTCHKEFNDVSVVVKHFTLHSDSRKCPRCGKVFPLVEDYQKHIEEVCQEEPPIEYTCDICKQTFRNEKYLYRHMAIHTDIHKCEKCGKCYSRKDSWQTHVLRCMPDTVDDLQIYVCNNCKKTFSTQLGADNHMANCAKHCCGECKTAFQSAEELKNHECVGSEASQDITIQFQCKKCNKNFSSLTYLSRHEASHQGAFECDICNRCFSRKEEHAMHHRFCMASQIIQETGQIECDICNVIHTDSKEYRDHYQSHTHPHQCPTCRKRFIKVGTLHNHKCEPTHYETTGELLSCDQCQKQFKSEKNLIRHRVIHGEPQFECKTCNRQFYRKDYLNDHVCSLPDGTRMRIIRNKNRVVIRENLVCHLCGRPFTSSSNLNKHMAVHGERKFECPICHKRFHFENYVRIHREMVHEKKFRFQCSFCGKVMTSKAGLMCHIRQFHTANAPIYKCPTCGKGFRQSGNLKTHMFSHEKEKKFVCTTCSRAFKYPEQLRRHKLEHTMVNKLSCEYCDKKFVRHYELKRHQAYFHSGIIYVCSLCNERCAHRYTMIRHFKRKHPHNLDLLEATSLDSMQHQGDVVEVKQETQETTILLETVQQFKDGLADNPTEIILPDSMAAEALQDLSNAVITTNSLGEETITIPSSIQSSLDGLETADGEQTVVILQIINPDDQEGVTEEVVSAMEGVEFVEQQTLEDQGQVMETVEIQPEGVSIEDIAGIEEQ